MPDKQTGNRKNTMKAIWVISGRLGWSSRKLHSKLVEWGFGPSLSVLDDAHLLAVRNKIESYYDSVKSQLDEQGLYMYSCMKQAGWDYLRVNRLIIKRYKGNEHYSLADNWRGLKQTQKRGIINTLKNCIKED